MKFTFLSLIILFSLNISAQVTLVVDFLPAGTPANDNIFVAGSINGWNPGDPNFQLSQNNQGKLQIVLDAKPEGTVIEYKFTRGSWETVEKGINGEEIDNRIFTYGNNDTIHLTILNWRNDGGDGSTASENVSVMSNDFYMPQLDKTRRIWIYLPPDYETSGKSYPVLYMHDGQNLFDASTSYAGEWEVDETLNTLFNNGIKVPIVVGIDNGGEARIDEYTPWSNPQYGGGGGENYAAFLTETLKPYIDQHYRTLQDRANTAIMGSSLGGIISHYSAINYQSVYSKAGIFSPSYWFSDSIYTFTEEHEKENSIRFYMMCGDNEGETTVTDMLSMAQLLKQSGFDSDDIKTVVIEGGEHNEKLWREQFKDAYLWLFHSWISTISEKRAIKNINIYPNPVEKIVQFPKDINFGAHDSLTITDVLGKPLIEVESYKGGAISVCGLQPGIYFFKLTSTGTIYTGQFIKQ